MFLQHKTLIKVFASASTVMGIHTTGKGYICSSEGLVSSMRKEYSMETLEQSQVPQNPHEMFDKWFKEACNAKLPEPNAMCLSTCKDNVPSARMVLLKSYDESGFLWFTNYSSRKGSELDSTKAAALTFWFAELERQVRIEGRVEKISEEESDAYFHSRPRGSQLGAWSSNQSQEISSREALEEQEREVKERFQHVEVVPRPTHWGGYRLVPTRVEFWKGRQSRMHDRLVYELAVPVSAGDSDSEQGGGGKAQKWSISRLQP